ncbi:MAG: hypothetical protein AB7G93_21355 [Bdellovibrionales bacterium]
MRILTVVVVFIFHFSYAQTSTTAVDTKLSRLYSLVANLEAANQEKNITKINKLTEQLDSAYAEVRDEVSKRSPGLGSRIEAALSHGKYTVALMTNKDEMQEAKIRAYLARLREEPLWPPIPPEIQKGPVGPQMTCVLELSRATSVWNNTESGSVIKENSTLVVKDSRGGVYVFNENGFNYQGFSDGKSRGCYSDGTRMYPWQMRLKVRDSGNFPYSQVTDRYDGISLNASKLESTGRYCDLSKVKPLDSQAKAVLKKAIIAAAKKVRDEYDSRVFMGANGQIIPAPESKPNPRNYAAALNACTSIADKEIQDALSQELRKFGVGGSSGPRTAPEANR